MDQLTLTGAGREYEDLFIYFIYLFIYSNFSQKDRGHTKGEPVLSALRYTHMYIHTYNYKDKQVTIYVNIYMDK